MMDEKLNMRRGLPPFEWWKNPLPEVKLRLYVFTVENAEEFLNGTDDKLRFQEIGPIVYQELLTHKDVVFHPENSTMSYTSTRTPIFKPEENEPGILNRTILVPNLTTLVSQTTNLH
jgi:scavenger receptor class B, member 1